MYMGPTSFGRPSFPTDTTSKQRRARSRVIAGIDGAHSGVTSGQPGQSRDERHASDPDHLAEVVAELQKAIEHHVEEEEGTVFPKMESDLGKIELEAVGANVQEFKGSA